MKLTEEIFQKDIEHHALNVVRDDGLYRHVVCAKPGSYCMHFEIVTWPGYLCYVGDMGSFTFSRIPDMFEFFRSDKGSINPDYWSEKIQACDRDGGYREWSEEKFREVIEYYLSGRGEEPVSEELRQAVKEEVLSRIEDGEHEAYRAANEFEHGGFRFDDLWDHNFKEFTLRFLWCCHAIVWAIQKFDALKSAQ